MPSADDLPPDKLRTAAIVQIVVGLIDLTLSVWIVGTFWGCLTGFCTMGICPFGAFAGLMVVPIGLLELVAGIVGLSNPRGAGTLMRVAGAAGLLGILVGSIASAVGGLIVLLHVSSPEVRAYLAEARPAE